MTRIFQYKAITRPPIAVPLRVSETAWLRETNQTQHEEHREETRAEFRPPHIPSAAVTPQAWRVETSQPQHREIRQETRAEFRPPVIPEAVVLPRFAWWQPTSQPHQIPPHKERESREEFRPFLLEPVILPKLAWLRETSQPQRPVPFSGSRSQIVRPLVVSDTPVSTTVSAIFDEAGIEETYEFSVVNVEATHFFSSGLNL